MVVFDDFGMIVLLYLYFLVDRSSGELEKSDYVTSSNAIPAASLDEYVKCFHDALKCELGDSSDTPRKLSLLMGGRLTLNIVLSLRCARSSWRAKFSFDLKPISLERIDMLESKLRDQQDELNQLRENLVVPVPHFVTLEASVKTGNGNLRWDSVESSHFTVTGEDDKIQTIHHGHYRVGGVVSCSPIGKNKVVRLMKNDKCIHWSYCGYAGGACVSSPLDVIVHMKKNDKLAINCTSDLSGTSYFSIVTITG
ncbi:unnamed protein product [Phytophthora lilii]|uniref:Unnamed protein product n=1 Tax=Phytophthora lilii TaxID=2077276 RepID=A0A9W6TMU5_9STRA|nr:unnamed protein product [Phytophthora lilii]